MEDGQLLMNNTDNIVITHGDFTVPPTTSTLVRDPILSPMDNGTYEVTVVNPAGESMTTYTVIVNGKVVDFMVSRSLFWIFYAVQMLYVYMYLLYTSYTRS